MTPQIRSQWRLLDARQQEKIFRALSSNLGLLCVNGNVNSQTKPYATYLIMCISAICVRIDNGLQILVNCAMDMFKNNMMTMNLMALDLISVDIQCLC